MNTDLLEARLNLLAVMRNIEDLPPLDPETGAMIQDWHTAIDFVVRGGPRAGLAFEHGQCRHIEGPPPSADIKLFFFSPAHLNAMFAGTSNPIPLRGFSKLGFLKREFTALTQRLEHFLRPTAGKLADPAYLRTNTLLTLFTGVFAVRHLAEHDPIAARLAMATPRGSVQFVIESEGPLAHLVYGDSGVVAGKGGLEHPSAITWFADWETANGILNGQMDPFTTAGKGLFRVEGLVPIADKSSLIMKRAAKFLE